MNRSFLCLIYRVPHLTSVHSLVRSFIQDGIKYNMLGPRKRAFSIPYRVVFGFGAKIFLLLLLWTFENSSKFTKTIAQLRFFLRMILSTTIPSHLLI